MQPPLLDRILSPADVGEKVVMLRPERFGYMSVVVLMSIVAPRGTCFLFETQSNVYDSVGVIKAFMTQHNNYKG